MRLVSGRLGGRLGGKKLRTELALECLNRLADGIGSDMARGAAGVRTKGTLPAAEKQRRSSGGVHDPSEAARRRAVKSESESGWSLATLV